MNIYEIAKEAGVSIATVSRVLNNNTKVSEKNRRKIMEIIEPLKNPTTPPKNLFNLPINGKRKTAFTVFARIFTTNINITNKTKPNIAFIIGTKIGLTTALAALFAKFIAVALLAKLSVIDSRNVSTVILKLSAALSTTPG